MVKQLLYRIHPGGEGFRLDEVDPNSYPRPVGLKKLIQLALDSEKEATAFLLASFILTAGDEEQRRLITRWQGRRTRNIQHTFPSVTQLVKKPLKTLELFSENTMSPSDFSDLLHESMAPVRKKLGLPETNPVEYSYSITPELLAFVQYPQCEKDLERISTASKGILYPSDYDYVRQILTRHLPYESAKYAVKLLKATKTREHLSAISLATAKSIEGEPYVSMANPHGASLTLEAWKFVKLIEDRDKPHLLATLSKLKYQSDSLFEFNLNKNGEVLAQFHQETSVIILVCRDEENHQVTDRASFIVDLDYLLCLYISLKRLREDRERFARLKEEADMTVPGDLFENLYIPLRDKEMP